MMLLLEKSFNASLKQFRKHTGEADGAVGGCCCSAVAFTFEDGEDVSNAVS